MDKKRLYTIFLIIFTNIFGAGMILPTLPLIATTQYGASEFQAAILATAYFAAQFIAAPILGQLSDWMGRRPILIISQIGTIASFLMFIFAEFLGSFVGGVASGLSMGGGLLVFFIARSLDGFTGGNITTAQAYVSDLSSAEERTKYLGQLTAAFGGGFIFGPAAGGLLATFGESMPFIGAAVVTAVTLLLTIVLLQESLPPEARGNRVLQKSNRVPLSEILKNKGFMILPLIGFIQVLAFSAIPPTFALYADQIFFVDETNPQIVQRNVGLILSFVGVVTVVTQVYFIQPLVKKLGERGLVLLGMSVLCIDLLVYPFFTNVWLATFVIAPFSFARGVNDPSLQSLVTRFATDKTRGQMLGVYQSALSLAFIFGPIWSGAVFQLIGPSYVFWVGGLILIPGVVASYYLKRMPVPTGPHTILQRNR